MNCQRGEKNKVPQKAETPECQHPWGQSVVCGSGTFFSERVSYMSVISSLPMSPASAWKCCQFWSTCRLNNHWACWEGSGLPVDPLFHRSLLGKSAHTANTQPPSPPHTHTHTYKMTPVTVTVYMWKCDGQEVGGGWHHIQRQKLRSFLSPVFSQANAGSQWPTAHWVLAPRGSLVLGSGVWVWAGVRGRLDDGRSVAAFMAGVKQLTAAWPEMEADPAALGQ